MRYDKINYSLVIEIKDALVEFILTRTSAYSLSNIFKTKFRAMRILWLLVFISFTFCSLLCIKQSIDDYLSYRVLTNFQVIDVVQSDFPAVAICNVNPFVTDYSIDYLKKIPKINDLVKNNRQNWKNMTDMKNIILSFTHRKRLNSSIRKRFGFKLNEIIFRCTFNKIDCNLYNDFNWFYDDTGNYGNCFTFNGGKNNSRSKTTSRTGKNFGLQLDLFVGYKKTDFNSIFGQGAHIFIYNQSEDMNDGFDVSVGFQTNIGIKRLFIEKKEYPYSNCQEADKINTELRFVKQIITSNQSYKQANCFDICIQDYLLKKCNCNRNASDKYGGIRHCQNDTELECFAKLSESFNESVWENGVCVKECPVECNRVQYQMTISQIDYPSEEVADLMRNDPLIKGKFSSSNNVSCNDLKKKLVSLNIYYDELGYTIIKEIPATWLINLISNIGGIICLFLGTSFVSFFEIFEAIFLISKIIFDQLKIQKCLNKVSNVK